MQQNDQKKFEIIEKKIDLLHFSLFPMFARKLLKLDSHETTFYPFFIKKNVQTSKKNLENQLQFLYG